MQRSVRVVCEDSSRDIKSMAVSDFIPKYQSQIALLGI